MKIIKKTAAILLCVCALITCAVPAFADSNESSSIIEGIDLFKVYGEKVKYVLTVGLINDISHCIGHLEIREEGTDKIILEESDPYYSGETDYNQSRMLFPRFILDNIDMIDESKNYYIYIPADAFYTDRLEYNGIDIPIMDYKEEFSGYDLLNNSFEPFLFGAFGWLKYGDRKTEGCDKIVDVTFGKKSNGLYEAAVIAAPPKYNDQLYIKAFSSSDFETPSDILTVTDGCKTYLKPEPGTVYIGLFNSNDEMIDSSYIDVSTSTKSKKEFKNLLESTKNNFLIFLGSLVEVPLGVLGLGGFTLLTLPLSIPTMFVLLFDGLFGLFR